MRSRRGSAAVLVLAVCTVMVLALTLAACGRTDGEESQMVEQSEPLETERVEKRQGTTTAVSDADIGTRRIIIDTDAGADDASAIIFAALAPNVVIEGVTVVTGNVDVDQGAKNALMALEVAGSDAKVYKGAAVSYSGREMVPDSVYGTDGMGDAGLVHPAGEAADTDAVDFILDTVANNPGEIEIVMIGPATNVAEALRRDPETMAQVKALWSMGTAGLGPGNASPVAEFNVYADAEAYNALLDAGLPITIVGLDMCRGESMWSEEQFQELAESGEIGAFVADSFGVMREESRGKGADAVKDCDAVAMVCALVPGFVRDSVCCHGSGVIDEGEDYAQVIFYQEGESYAMAPPDGATYNATLVTDVDKASFFDIYLKAVSSS